jgi:hypothetical protein
MSVFIDSNQALLNYLNTANSTTMFTLTNLLWSSPAPIAGTWMEGTTTKNTYMKVTAAAGAGFEGKATIKYDRLKLSDFAAFKPTRTLKCYKPVTTHDLLPNILYYFGLVIGKQDIVDEPLTLVDGVGTVTLKAKATSPLWLDQLTFDVIEGGANLADQLTVKALNGLNYPVTDPTTQTSALLYTYPLNLTAYRDELLAMVEGTLTQAQADRLVVMLKALDKGPGATLWNSDGSSKSWSVAGAKVIFCGLNSMVFPTNQSYKYVMCLELRADVTVPTGRFYLHFNDPDNPNSAD